MKNELEEQIKYLQDPRQSADYDLDYENGTVLEYLLTIRQQQADLKDADKYALELERLYEDAKAEIEALKANRKHDFGLGEASGFIKGHKENPYKAITNTKIEPTVVSYTHPVKELTDEVIEQVRVAIMGAAYWCADENMPEAYNAVKVCCGQVLGILVKAQEK